jgi:hypothetical protein
MEVREGRLFTKISLSLACVIFVVAESQAQTNRKNELGLLLGATVTAENKRSSICAPGKPFGNDRADCYST